MAGLLRGGLMRIIRVAALVGVTVLVSQLGIPSAVATPRRPTCYYVRATLIGTTGDDHLVGTSGTDVIVGLAGDDLIEGADGEDQICGNSGDDSIFGGSGGDFIQGGGGADSIDGGSGIDRLYGGEGDDYLYAVDGEPDGVHAGVARRDGLLGDTCIVDPVDGRQGCDLGRR
jgi:Ca2+-binding RTX toxin-like protein